MVCNLVQQHHEEENAKSLIANLGTTKARWYAHPPISCGRVLDVLSHVHPLVVNVLGGYAITRLTGVESALHKMVLGLVWTSLTFIENDPWSNMYTVLRAPWRY